MSSFHFLKSYNRVKKFSGGVHFKIIFGKIRGREMQSVYTIWWCRNRGGMSWRATEPYIRSSGRKLVFKRASN